VPFVRELTLERGQTVPVDAALDTTGQRKVAYAVLLGAGLLAAGTAKTVTLAFIAQGKAQDLLAQRDTMNWSGADIDEHNRQRGRRDDLATASYILGGAATAVAGLLLYFVDTPRVVAPGRGPELVPTLGPDEIGASLVRQF
jgi:hypothetical protein